MRLSPLAAILIIGILLATGLRLDSLPFQPEAGFSDAAVSHYPAAWHLHHSLRVEGNFPVWQELNMGGQPFAANPLNKTAYPLQWLAVLLPPLLHLNVMIVLHILLAAWGMMRWVQALGLPTEAATLATLAYALAPRAIGHLSAGHLDFIYALAWFPWLMLAVHHACHQPFALRHALRLALFAALLLLADVRLSLFAFTAAAAYGVYECWRLRRWSAVRSGIAALIPFGLLVAALVLPLLLWSPWLNRAALTPDDAGLFSLPPALLTGMLLPFPVSNIEYVTYIGLPILALAFIAVWQQPRLYLLWLGLLLAATFYALGSNTIVWQTVVNIFPFLSWFRVPARAWFIVALIMPLLTAYGLQMLLQIRDGTLKLSRRTQQQTRLALTGLAALVAVLGIVLLATQVSVGIRWLVVGISTVIILWLSLSGRFTTHAISVSLALLFAFDLGANALQSLEWRGRDDWGTPYVVLAETLRTDGADRVYSPAYSLPQQIAAEYGLSIFGGVDPFQLRANAEAIQQASGVAAQGYSVVQPPLLGGEGDDLSTVNRDALPDTRLLARWQVSHVVAPYPIDLPTLELARRIDDLYVYRNTDYMMTLRQGIIPRWAETVTTPAADLVHGYNTLTWQSHLLSALAFCLFTSLYAALEFKRR
jgi:hypothetical protein